MVNSAPVPYFYFCPLFLFPSRSGHRRVYEAGDLERVRMVSMARRLGFTVADLRVLSRADGGTDRAAWRQTIAAKIAQVDRNLADLTLVRAKLALIGDCGCPSPSQCDLMGA